MSLSDGSSIPEIAAADAVALIDTGAVLLDVREQDEWLAGHAPGAVHVPLGALKAGSDALPEGFAIAGERVVVVCRVGGRSAIATAALVAWGHDALNLVGGMYAWEQASLPVVTDDGAPGQVI